MADSVMERQNVSDLPVTPEESPMEEFPEIPEPDSDGVSDLSLPPEEIPEVPKPAFGIVTVRLDGSYVVTRNGHPYHVPNGGEWAELWAEVDAYARANPDMATAEPLPPEPAPEEKQAAMLKAFTGAIQARLDAFARTRGYDNIHTAATYDGDPDPVFSVEGRYAKEIRGAAWRAAYGVLNPALAGDRPMPTLEEVFAELPELVWPINGTDPPE